MVLSHCLHNAKSNVVMSHLYMLNVDAYFSNFILPIESRALMCFLDYMLRISIVNFKVRG